MIVSISIIVVVLICCIGVNLYNKTRTYHVRIIGTLYNVGGKKSQKIVFEDKVKLNDTLKVDGYLGDELTFKIIKVSNNSITVKTSEVMSSMVVNLLSQEDEFVINKNEETIINRLVTDMGISYSILVK